MKSTTINYDFRAMLYKKFYSMSAGAKDMKMTAATLSQLLRCHRKPTAAQLKIFRRHFGPYKVKKAFEVCPSPKPEVFIEPETKGRSS